MPTIFIGLLALALVLWLAKSFAKADPKYVINVGRTAGGIVALAGAAFLGVRGQLGVAVPLGVTPRTAAPASATIPPAVRPTLIKYFGSALANDFASHSTRASASRPMKIVGMSISSAPGA